MVFNERVAEETKDQVSVNVLIDFNRLSFSRVTFNDRVVRGDLKGSPHVHQREMTQ